MFSYKSNKVSGMDKRHRKRDHLTYKQNTSFHNLEIFQEEEDDANP
jgi:hypothetical protein